MYRIVERRGRKERERDVCFFGSDNGRGMMVLGAVGVG